MSSWQNHSIDERISMIQSVAQDHNIEDNAVEKDWWVTVVLKALYGRRAANALPSTARLIQRLVKIAMHQPGAKHENPRQPFPPAPRQIHRAPQLGAAPRARGGHHPARPLRALSGR